MVSSPEGETNVTQEFVDEVWTRIVKIEQHLKARGIDVTEDVPEPAPEPEPHKPLERQAPGTSK